MEIVVFWILFSVAVGIFAANKGRSGLGWFLFSIFLSPLLGLIFVAVIRDKRLEAKVDAMHRGPGADEAHLMKECADCGEMVRRNAKVCRYCGFRFSG